MRPGKYKMASYLLPLPKTLLWAGLFTFFAWTNSACKKSIDIKLPDAGTKIVLNALMNEDSVIYVRLTRLNNNLSTVFAEEEATTVSLYENGVFKENLFKEERNGLMFYRGWERVARGSRYKITAATSIGQIEGEDVIPGMAEVYNVVLARERDEEGDLVLKLRFTIKDVPGIQNYYRFRVFNPDTATSAHTAVNFTVDGRVQSGNDLPFGKIYNNFFDDDTLFDGDELTYILTLEGLLSNNATLEVTALTPVSYQYLKSSYTAFVTSGNPLVDQTPVFSNIQNGLGIVGGIALKKITIN